MYENGVQWDTRNVLTFVCNLEITTNDFNVAK